MYVRMHIIGSNYSWLYILHAVLLAMSTQIPEYHFSYVCNYPKTCYHIVCTTGSL